MATLSETAYYARKGINLLIIASIVIIIVRVIIITIEPWLRPQEKPLPPTVSFGKLPYPNAQSDLDIPKGPFTYSLETVDNKLPVVPNPMNVYFLPLPKVTSLSRDDMKDRAARLGFTGNPIKLQDTLWRFIDPVNSLRSLEIDEVTGHFTLRYNYALDQNLFQENTLTTADQGAATNALRQALGGIPAELSGKQTISYLKLVNSQLIPFPSLDIADAMVVTFNRTDIPGPAKDQKISYPVLSPNAAKGVNYALVSPASDPKKKILEMRYVFLPQAPGVPPGTYPTISAEEAFSLLQKGEAIIASLPENFTNAVSVRQAYFAYLEPYPTQTYLEPIMVFSDRKGFLAYVPLISREWLVKSEPLKTTK